MLKIHAAVTHLAYN